MPGTLPLARPLACALAVAALNAPCPAQAVPDFDFDWATISAPGNPAFAGPSPGGIATGRGSVDAPFRISRLEVTTAQWLEFANAVGPLGENFGIGDQPVGGYEPDPAWAGPGRRYRLRAVPDAARLPVIGISWLNAARYCNWLHNDKAPTLAALIGGAYDTTTFGVDPSTGARTDTLARAPGARFFIPNLDEWMKAVYFDPAAGAWRSQPLGSDAQPVPGPAVSPGATTNAGLANSPGFPASSLLLGAYAPAASPWGLLDASGGASEWLEDADDPQDRLYRLHAGSSAFDAFNNPQLLDRIGGVGASAPAAISATIGLRLASAIPDPSVSGCIFCGLALRSRRRRPCAKPNAPSDSSSARAPR
jgi:hypothetical protein